MNSPDAAHADPCRSCGHICRRSEMIKAARVLKRQNARGWYCKACAGRVARLETLLTGMKPENAPKPRRHATPKHPRPPKPRRHS